MDIIIQYNILSTWFLDIRIYKPIVRLSIYLHVQENYYRSIPQLHIALKETE